MMLNVENGLTLKSKAKPILGYSDTSTVKLDFDGKKYRVVKYWAKRICMFFKLQGFRILKSSPNNYHVVFNRSVSWTENLHIMNWAVLMVEGKQLRPLTRYVVMQAIKESSCLRIGKKKEKPVPRTVFEFGEQSNEIKNYLIFWRMCRKF